MRHHARRSGPSITASAEPSSERACDHPDCCRPGEYRAPRSRAALTEYYWFCLDHVRDYNRAWDFCQGMTETEIEQHIRQDTVWHRPTWPLGSIGARFRVDLDAMHDRFGMFGWDLGAEGAQTTPRRRPDGPEDLAMRAMELSWPLTKEAVKARYKELVKRLHPDTHGGDTTSEERLKVIIEAYKTLMSSLNA